MQKGVNEVSANFPTAPPVKKGVNEVSRLDCLTSPPVKKEEFATIREFNKKFPSKLYICSRCQGLSADPYHCTNCNNQSNSLLFMHNTYTYTIKDINLTNTIFRPIELERNACAPAPQEKGR